MEIEAFLAATKQPKYRLNQFNTAFYQHYLADFEAFTNWPAALRTEAKKVVKLQTLKPLNTQISADRGTVKVLFERVSCPGELLEAVLMKHQDKRNSVCVSSMVGCPMGCVFCATGGMGFVANLSAAEIVEQVLYFSRLLKAEKQKVTNIVFMGMGEPMINLAATQEAIAILTDKNRFALGSRGITVSTCGVTSALKKFVNDGYKGRLALSLHAPNQKLREAIMPVAKTNPLKELLEVIDLYVQKTNRRVSYEYILIKDLNDQKEHAQELSILLKNRLAHVNLIPYNSVPGKSFASPSKKTIFAFALELEKMGIPYTIRITMGADIQAACGQLAAKGVPKSSQTSTTPAEKEATIQ